MQAVILGSGRKGYCVLASEESLRRYCPPRLRISSPLIAFWMEQPEAHFLGFFFISPAVQLSSRTTSAVLSLYSTLKSNIRERRSTTCRLGTTGRKADPEDEEEEAMGAEGLGGGLGPNTGFCIVSELNSLCKIPFSCGITPFIAANKSQLFCSSSVMASSMFSMPVHAWKSARTISLSVLEAMSPGEASVWSEGSPASRS